MTYSWIMILGSSAVACCSLWMYLRTMGGFASVDRNGLKLHRTYFLFYFAIAPVLHFGFGVFIDVEVDDQVSALVRLNLMHTLGLVISTAVLLLLPPTRPKPEGPTEPNWLRLSYVSYVFICAGLITYIMLWREYGAALLIETSSSDKTTVSIVYFMMVESVPMLCGWVYICHVKSKRFVPRKLEFALFLAFLVVVSIFFSGLRGSRVAVIFQVLGFLLLYHAILRRITTKELVIMLFAAAAFNSVYSIYKYSGVEGIETFVATGEKPDFVARQSSLAEVVLHDLGRSDVNALIIDRVFKEEYVPPYFPHTYLYGLQLLLPESLRSENVLGKAALGFSAQYHTSPDKANTSSRIYGFAGEAALNFGLWFVGLVYGIFALVHRRALMIAESCKRNTKVVFYPLFVLIPVFLLFYDFDNIVFTVVKSWGVPLFVFLISKVRSAPVARV